MSAFYTSEVCLLCSSTLCLKTWSRIIHFCNTINIWFDEFGMKECDRHTEPWCQLYAHLGWNGTWSVSLLRNIGAQTHYCTDWKGTTSHRNTFSLWKAFQEEWILLELHKRDRLHTVPQNKTVQVIKLPACSSDPRPTENVQHKLCQNTLHCYKKFSLSSLLDYSNIC